MNNNKNMLKPLFYMLLTVILSFLCGCSKIAIDMTPAKKPIESNTPLAKHAESQFWQTLHQGDYDHLSDTINLLTAAYLENPNDPKLAANLAFSHMWMIAERNRQNTFEPTLVNHIVLARKYFTDAVALDPNDARFLGFLGDSYLAEGQIFHDEKQQVRGYFILKDAIHAWPQFNYFTAGYAMSFLPSDSNKFKKGLEWQWRTLDVCAHTKIDRKNPDFSPYMKLETTHGADRACWNSWIAPFNFEGFFLNMGDMLVKSGDWQTAIQIYNNAKLASNYNDWPYKNILEDHIRNAKSYVAVFNHDYPLNQPTPQPAIMFNSPYACMGCHQENAK